eukprot:10416284-Alexandrium_andersonii.AAC.1
MPAQGAGALRANTSRRRLSRALAGVGGRGMGQGRGLGQDAAGCAARVSRGCGREGGLGRPCC